ncbi:MAG: NAD-dependent deacetylase [Verrucomicrobia bacterium]|jgi:NAD-dependent deacetylase|nr:MAG: NAD-dependent deacetylase [Verrucomicrobiota bacterium]
MTKKAGQSIVILTGSGISAESGLPTFRGSDGLWQGRRVEEVATPEAFEREPLLVQQFYNLRRAALQRVEPNAAHLALAALEREWPGEYLLITQNVDDLHFRAGSRRLLSIHGELRRARCLSCGADTPWMEDLTPDSSCPRCHEVGKLRPHIVWFGEAPMHMDQCLDALSQADLFVAIGTSGKVYPAASFVDFVASRPGTRRLELNQEATGNPRFNEVRIGPATETVQALVAELLA